MIQMQLINSIVEWEKRLEYEEKRLENHRFDPYVNYLAAPQPCRKDRKTIFAQIFRRNKYQAPVSPCYREEPCQETQTC